MANDGGSGGALWLEGVSSPLVSRCEIHLNTVGGMGGGIAVDISATPTIRDCYIHDNTASTGGGICWAASGGVMSGCTVTRNDATFGGGLAMMSGLDVAVSNTRVADNESVHSGGGLYASDSTVEVRRCEIDDNFTQGAGGGVWLLNTEVVIAETGVRGNSAIGSTGGILVDTSSLTVSSSEIAGNGTGITVLGVSEARVDVRGTGPPRSLTDARHNWWGDDTGPYHPVLNPTGLGDAVSDGVQFVPWNTTTGIASDSWTIPASWGAIKALHLTPRP